MKRSSQESEARLFAVAESQGGYFTAKQAEEAGFDRTNHTYHVRAGNWEREHRGIFRLAHFPANERPDLVRWSLWSRDRQDHPQGVYSHQTALSIHDLSDLMPAKAAHDGASEISQEFQNTARACPALCRPSRRGN